MDLLRGDARAEAALEERQRALQRWAENGAEQWSKEFEKTCDVAAQHFVARARARSDELLALRRSLPNVSRAEVDEAAAAVRRVPEDLLLELLSEARRTIEKASARVREHMAEDGLDGPLKALVATRAVEGRLSMTHSSSEFDLVQDVRAALGGGVVAVGAVNVLLAKVGLVAAAANPILWPFAVGGLVFGGYSWWHRHTRRNRTETIALVDEVRSHLTGIVVETATVAFSKAAQTVRDEIVATLKDQREKVESDRRMLALADELSSHPELRDAHVAELRALEQRAEALQAVATLLRDEMG